MEKLPEQHWFSAFKVSIISLILLLLIPDCRSYAVSSLMREPVVILLKQKSYSDEKAFENHIIILVRADPACFDSACHRACNFQG